MPRIFSEQERELIRSKLLNAGLRELEHTAYRNISIDGIVAAVGIAKGTFYNFFDSKEAYFYEIMQLIKERNRDGLKALAGGGQPTRAQLVDCLYHRYTQMKTVYDYFSPAEIKVITRKLPDDALENDSVDFAEVLCGRIRPLDKAEAEAVVGMCNILGIAASNRSVLDGDSYERAVRVFCGALADYILGGKS